MRESYFGQGRTRGLRARAVEQLLARLREWDKRTASRVTYFVAISKTVQQRIAECYRRESEVIYPPVDTDFYSLAAVPRDNFYLAVSAFAPYKRLDLAIEVCNRLRRELIIIGTGQEQARLREMAGPSVHFLGWQPDAVIREHFRRCRALLFPGEEDFGIVPVEAMACGAPVIAFGRGGATETVVPPGGRREPTGVWFQEQSAESLSEAIITLEAMAGEFSPAAGRRQAQRFNAWRFTEEIFAYLNAFRHAPAPTIRLAA